MLIAASCPSNRDAAVTKRRGARDAFPDASGKSLAAVLIDRSPARVIRQNTSRSATNTELFQQLAALQKF
jgi:hypothetical protein